jgi:hypothetical protein
MVAMVIAALATLISLAWTLGQNATPLEASRNNPNVGTRAPHAFHQRFAMNFRRKLS